MITVKGKTLMVSARDTLLTFFKVHGAALDGSETIYFNINEEPDGSKLVKRIACGIDTLNNIICVYAPKEEMAVLKGGWTYWYDMTMDTPQGMHMTLIYPSRFVVREVMHSD